MSVPSTRARELIAIKHNIHSGMAEKYNEVMEGVD